MEPYMPDARVVQRKGTSPSLLSITYPASELIHPADLRGSYYPRGYGHVSPVRAKYYPYQV